MANLTPGGATVASCSNDDACEVVQCEVCMSEVPSSVAHSFEGKDYVHHFCGLECFGVWRAKHEHEHEHEVQ